MTLIAAPYDESTPDLLTRTLTHIARATLITDAGDEVPLDLEDGTLRWDETQSPRVQATLTCTLPDDPALLWRIDPRLGVRIVLDIGYLRPGGYEDVHRIADLGLRTRVVNRPERTIELEAHSDEALLIDNAASTSLPINTTSTTAAITAVINLALTPTLPILVTAAAGPAVNQTQVNADKWETIADLADGIGAQVYDDGLRQWHIAPRVTAVAADPVYELTVGASGTIIAARNTLSRVPDVGGWANRVYLRYAWTDAGGVDHVITSVRQITSGTYRADTGNVVTLPLERTVATTQARADAAAAALVARTVTRGARLDQTAIAAYWLRPGMTVGITQAVGDRSKHVVSAVDFDLVAGTMQVTPRLPDNTGSIG